MKERELPVIIAACVLSAVLATTQAQEAKPDDIIIMTAEEARAAGVVDADGNILGKVMTVEEARAAGLDVAAIPSVAFSLDEIRELESIEAMLERVVEHAKAHVGDDALLTAPLITPDLERMMQAIESDDADLLNEVLSDITGGVPVRLPTEEEQRLHDEGAIYAPRVRAATTDEVLASMRPERAEALADYRHLLDDEFELIASLDNIKPRPGEGEFAVVSVEGASQGLFVGLRLAIRQACPVGFGSYARILARCTLSGRALVRSAAPECQS